MTKKLSALLIAVLTIHSPEASAQVTTRCPVVVAKKAGEYQALNRRDFVCYSTTSRARRAGYIKGNLVNASAFEAATSFSTGGIGRVNSPAFRVASKSARIDFNYSGSGDFVLDLIDQTTGRSIERLAQSKGPATGTTYVNTRGVFYLRIEGENQRATEASAQPRWDLTLTTP